MGIIDRYLEQVKKDRMNENTELPEELYGEKMNGEEMKKYKEEVNKIRSSEDDMEKVYTKMMNSMTQYTEEEMKNKDILASENITDVKVYHAYCDECGEELISQGPPMFNPFTMVKTCIHKCNKCGKQFNLEYSYPRLAFFNNEGVEIKAFTI